MAVDVRAIRSHDDIRHHRRGGRSRSRPRRKGGPSPARLRPRRSRLVSRECLAGSRPLDASSRGRRKGRRPGPEAEVEAVPSSLMVRIWRRSEIKAALDPSRLHFGGRPVGGRPHRSAVPCSCGPRSNLAVSWPGGFIVRPAICSRRMSPPTTCSRPSGRSPSEGPKETWEGPMKTTRRSGCFVCSPMDSASQGSPQWDNLLSQAVEEGLITPALSPAERRTVFVDGQADHRGGWSWRSRFRPTSASPVCSWSTSTTCLCLLHWTNFTPPWCAMTHGATERRARCVPRGSLRRLRRRRPLQPSHAAAVHGRCAPGCHRQRPPVPPGARTGRMRVATASSR